MVINNDPSYAYLLENNALVDQKIVMAHVTVMQFLQEFTGFPPRTAK
jgi:spore cortex formation protein SpoVR/YcgB (stage V sporulation)